MWSLVVCFAVALGCRLVRRSGELLSSDAADLASDVAKLLCSQKPLGSQLGDLLLFRLGGVQPLVVYSHGLIAKVFDTPLEPTSWEWSTILVSSASSPLAFLVGRRFGGVWAGWAWAIFLAVSPIHVMLGRNLGAPWAYEINFQLLILWLLDRHLRHGGSSAAALWSTVAAYVWCGNQMPAIFPVIAFALLAHARDQPPGARIGFIARKLGSVWLLAPIVSSAVLLYCTFGLHRGHLYHALFDKRKALGWYWDNFYADLVHNLGYLPAWLALGGLLCAVFCPWSALDKRRIPLVYTFCYAMPFVVLVSRQTTLTRGYCVYGLTGLLGLVALVPTHLESMGHRLALGLERWRHASTLAFHGLTSILLLGAAGASVYKLYSNQPFLGVAGFQGSYKEPIGAAAAAAFIAKLTSAPAGPSGKVFSDAYGGAGLEPPIMRLYFRRPVLAKYDAARKAPWEAFAPRAAEVGYAVIRPENASLVGKHFPRLKLAATIEAKNKKPILLVYARDYASAPSRLSAREGIATYSQSFSGFCVN